MNAENELKKIAQQIVDEVELEWSKKHFKWFMKQRRLNKLRCKVVNRYKARIFKVVSAAVERKTRSTVRSSLENMTDYKDVALGDKNYFVEDSYGRIKR